MIKNEKQYKITKSQLLTLRKAMEMGEVESYEDVHPLLIKAQKEAIKSQFDDLNSQIEEYEALKQGAAAQVEVGSFDLLPLGLIKARIAKGLSQKELAERLGLKEQQIQRYEATDYATASFERLRQVITALGIKIRENIFLSDAAYSKEVLFKNLEKIGIGKELTINKLIPQKLRYKLEHIEQLVEEEAHNLIIKIASSVSNVFNLSLADLFKPNADVVLTGIAGTRYKKAINANATRTSVYTMYAHSLALILFQASKTSIQKPVPEDPFEIRKIILRDFDEINFSTVVKYIWSLGIPVIALNDPGAFHGACWRIQGFNVIALKQKFMSEAVWTYDAIHELCHAGQHPEQETLDVIETEEKTRSELENEDESDANYFAAEVFLGEEVDDIAEECIIRARNNIPQLKSAVEFVAKKYKLNVGGLANYLAFRLMKEQGVDWWGTARNLQPQGFSPWNLCREMILENCDFSKLNEFDRDLLINAIS